MLGHDVLLSCASGAGCAAASRVTKPFSLEELVARIRSILRRSGLAEPESSRLVFEDLELDEDAHAPPSSRML